MQVSQRIKFVCKIKGITQSKMINDLGLNTNFIYKSSQNKYGMNTAYLYAICEYLQVSADFLIGLTDTLLIDNLAYTIKTHTEIVKTDNEKIEV